VKARRAKLQVIREAGENQDPGVGSRPIKKTEHERLCKKAEETKQGGAPATVRVERKDRKHSKKTPGLGKGGSCGRGKVLQGMSKKKNDYGKEGPNNG